MTIKLIDLHYFQSITNRANLIELENTHIFGHDPWGWGIDAWSSWKTWAKFPQQNVSATESKTGLAKEPTTLEDCNLGYNTNLCFS